MALLVACGDGSGPSAPVTITGSFLLSTVNGAAVPVDVFGPGGSARITGATLRLNPNGRYAIALAARVDLGGGPLWSVDRGGGTFTTAGNTVRFGDAGDGEGPFTGTVSGDRLTIVDAGVTLVFVRAVVIDEITVTPGQVDLTSCRPLTLAAAALNTDSGTVQNPTITWHSSNESIATVDATGGVTPRGVGSVSIVATAGAGIDSAVVDVAFTMPAPVTLQSVTWEGEFPRLTWTPADPQSFCYYRVVFDANHGGGAPNAAIDSIPDVATTTVLDTRILALQGLTMDYQVQVHNGPHVAASQPVHTEYGSSIPLAPYGDRAYRPRVSPTRDELYLQGAVPGTTGLDDTLRAVSTVTNSVLRGRFIGRRPFTVSTDGASIHVISYFPIFATDSLLTLNAATFVPVAAVRLPFGTSATGSLVAGRAGRIYVAHADFGSGESSIKAVDVATGNEVGALIFSTDPSMVGDGPPLAVSPDNNTLYAAGYGKVWKIDVTTDNISVVDTQSISYGVEAIQLSPDGARLHLLVTNPRVIEIWDAAALTFSNRLSPPNLFDFFVTATHIFASQSTGGRPGDRYFLSGDVVRYDATSLAVTASWGFVLVPSWIVVARDGSRFYTNGPGERTLVIPGN